MKLVPITTKDLPPLDRALPFPLRDAAGRLLLNAGVKVTDDRLRQELLQTLLFAEEQHCLDWQRRLNAAMDQRLREGAALKDVVAALPGELPREAVARSLSTGDAWFELRSRLDAVLRDLGPGSDALARLDELHARGRALLQRRADESLYHLVYEAVHYSERYSAHHAWMTLALAEQTAAVLGWPQAQVGRQPGPRRAGHERGDHPPAGPPGHRAGAAHGRAAPRDRRPR
ncbi:MAG: hypothetical protein ACK57B_05755 [Betaproteobacteria bacterium]